MPPRDQLVNLYKAQGWNDEAAINADINAGGWKSKVQAPTAGFNLSSSSGANVTPQSFTQNPVQSAIDIAKSLREQNIQAAQPAIQTLESGKQPLTDRYNKIIEDIKGRRETAVQQTGISTATEFGKRGLPTSSGAYDVALRQATIPVEQAYGQTITGAEGEREDKLSAIRNAIAGLQSGAGNVDIKDALSILTTAKSFEPSATDISKNYLSLGEGSTLYDLLQGRALYTAPKTYKPEDTFGNSSDPLGLG